MNVDKVVDAFLKLSHSIDQGHDNIGQFAPGGGGSGAPSSGGNGGGSGDLKVSDEEKKFVKFYTEFGFVEVNDRLRTGKALGKREQDTVRHLDAVISRAGTVPQPRTLFRGVSIRPGELEPFIASAESGIGKKVTLKGYQSTSSDRKIASDFAKSGGKGVLFQISSKSGADLSKISGKPNEKEILLARDKSYVVRKVVRGSKVTVIHLEE